jgi:hypothetical protein
MFEDPSLSPQHSVDWNTLATLTGFTREIPEASPSSSENTSVHTPIELDQTDSSENKAKPDDEAEVARSSNPTDEADDLLDPEDLDEQAQTKSRLWTNPLAKGGFVAGVVGVGVGGIGLFLHSVQGMKPSFQARVDSPPASQDTAPPVDPKQEEIAKLKTVNALGTQAQALKQSQAVANVKTLPTAKAKLPTNRLNDRSTDRPVTTIDAPRIRPDVPPITPEYGTVTRAPLTTIRPAATITSAMPVSRTTAFLQQQPQFDPQTVWRTALNTGSYGQTNNQKPDSNVLSNDPSSATLVDSRTLANASSISSVQGKSLKPDAPSDSEPRSVTDDSRYERDTTAILSGVQSNYSTVGTGITASATLVTPIVWAADLKIDSAKQFIIQLDRPIVSEGKVVLEQGTRLIAQVQATSDSGAVQLSIAGIVKSTPDGEQMVNLPRGAISVNADDGRPLIADRQSRSRQPGVNFGTVLSGALSQVGSTLTQPQSQISTTSPYTSSTTVTNGNSNIVGSVLQGAFGSVTQQLQQRNQQAQTVQQQQDFWTIPSGRHLQLMVTASFGVEI